MDSSNSSALLILINLSGWVVVGYLIRDYFQESKRIKQDLSSTLRAYNDIKTDLELQKQRLNYIEDSIEHIAISVDDIKRSLDINNKILLQELKSEIRDLRKSQS